MPSTDFNHWYCCMCLLASDSSILPYHLSGSTLFAGSNSLMMRPLMLSWSGACLFLWRHPGLRWRIRHGAHHLLDPPPHVAHREETQVDLGALQIQRMTEHIMYPCYYILVVEGRLLDHRCYSVLVQFGRLSLFRRP